MSLRFHSLDVGIGLEPALSAICDGVGAALARSGSEHGSARAVLDRFRSDAADLLLAVRRSLRTATCVARGSMGGGHAGRLSLFGSDLLFDGSPTLSQATAPQCPPPPHHRVNARGHPYGRPCGRLSRFVWARLALSLSNTLLPSPPPGTRPQLISPPAIRPYTLLPSPPPARARSSSRRRPSDRTPSSRP